MKQEPHRPNARRLLRQIGSRYALSNMSLLLFMIPAFGSGLIFDLIRFDSGLGTRLLSATAGYFGTIIPLLIARIFFPDKPRESRPLALMLVFFVAGLSRGLTLIGVSVVSGEYQSGDEIFRLIGAPIFTVIMMTICVVLTSNYKRHRAALSDLANERHRLQLRSASIRAKVEIQREQLLSRVRDLLNPAIARVQQNLAGESGVAIAALRSTVEDVVRPLSSELTETADELEELLPSAVREKAPLPQSIRLGEFVLPLWGAVVTAVVSVSIAFLYENGFSALAVTFFSFLLMYLGLGLFHLLTRNVQTPTVVAAILAPVAYSVSLSPFYLLVPLFGWNFSIAQINAFMLFGFMVGLSLFFSQFVQYQRASTTEKLVAVNQQLEIVNGALRQELWLNRRRTASLLHGPVQAALYASAIKLSQQQNPSEQILSEIQSDISNALEKLNNPSNLELESLGSVLEQIVDVWDGTAEITIDLPDELAEVISNQPLATESLVEVVREFVTNAIRHGGANKISVRVFRIDEHRFAIEVIDNGSGISPDSKPGFGSKLISELSLRFSQTSEQDTTRSYAEIVLSSANL